MRSRGGSGQTATSTVVEGLLLSGLTVVTVGLCVLAFRNQGDPTSELLQEIQPSSPLVASEAPSATSSPSNTDTEASPPQVKDQRRADFTVGDGLPDGSRIFDSSTSSGMALQDGLLVHGLPDGTAAASYLETRLQDDVAQLGARLRFPADPSGSVALVAWPSSVVDAGRRDDRLPAAGMRLVVTSQSWKVTVGPDRAVIGEGSFDAVGTSLNVEVVRDRDDLWVTDPEGGVTQMTDPRVSELAGPWACWELFETSANQSPATIEAVWAG